MAKKQSTINDDILLMFKRACQENDLQVAEHLLHALELLAQRNENDQHVTLAYLMFADSLCRP